MHTTKLVPLFMLLALALSTEALAQSVCLPAPRLLTIMPMGGQVGTEFEVTITGQNLDDIESLVFSNSSIVATPALLAAGTRKPNAFIVRIHDDCLVGIHEARILSRLGMSTPRVFTVGRLAESLQSSPSNSVETAFAIQPNSICNATIPVRSINHYAFEATKGQRYWIDCAAKGIDSKMNPVLIVADELGNDLVVERRGGAIDFTAEADGVHIVKVHELTFKGGPEFFYRLAIQEIADDEIALRQPQTLAVNTFSWPPVALNDELLAFETEPNSGTANPTVISLPCDVRGSFYPAADVDVFEFTAQAGEEWWIEIASERIGCPTDPNLVVLQLKHDGDQSSVVEIGELTDIASPVKRSSNGYSYDGPPYNAGSTDFHGMIQIPEDGTYRLQLSDLFGGTRNDPNNEYRLIVRKAQPDFALVAWALHMELRNGDRNALSKPISLRGGATMALEVIAFRRDGFDGEIHLQMDNLPDGVSASGLSIPAGQNRGMMLITAHQDSPRGVSLADFTGTALVDGEMIQRPVRWASMAWPVANAWTEIPSPRLLSSVPVSVGGSEFAGVSIAPMESRVWEVETGASLEIPLLLTRRHDFSGSTLALKTLGSLFERNAPFDVSLDAEKSVAKIDLSRVTAPPGEYVVSFYGSAVEKYRLNPQSVTRFENELAVARAELQQCEAEIARLNQVIAEATANADALKTAQVSLQSAIESQNDIQSRIAEAEKRLQQAQTQSQPRDIADIVVSEPITIRILSEEN